MRLLLIAFLACFFTAGLCQTKSENKKDTAGIVFSRVNVVDVEAGSVLPDRDVFVRGDRIISIRSHNNAGSRKQKGVRLIPAQGKYLMPGLIDCHTHLFYKEDLLPYLRNGVTTVFTLGQPQEVLTWRDNIKKGILTGPTVYAGALVDTVPQDWNDSIYSYVVHSAADVDTAMTRITQLRYDFIKAYNSLTIPEFDEIMRLANLHNLPVIGHGVRQPGMEYILSKGMAMVAHGEEYLYTTFRDSLDESKIPAAVAFTKKYGAFVCPNLSTFQTIMTQWGDSLKFAGLLQEAGDAEHRVSPGIFSFWINSNHYTHRGGSPLVPMYPFLQKFTYALYKAGVPLVTGTDSPVIPGCFPGYSLAKEVRLLTETGIPAADALKIATLVPGRFISQYFSDDIKTGIVKEGYRADLLLLSGNPLQDVQNLRNVEGVMAKGTWYMPEQLVAGKTE